MIVYLPHFSIIVGMLYIGLVLNQSLPQFQQINSLIMRFLSVSFKNILSNHGTFLAISFNITWMFPVLGTLNFFYQHIFGETLIVADFTEHIVNLVCL